MSKTIASVFFLIAMMGITSKAHAQAAIIALLFGDKVASEKFNISMELGANFSQFSDVPDSKQFRPGINFGIAGNIMLAENWFVSPTAYFLSNRRVELESFDLNTGNPSLDTEFTNRDAELIVNYIDVPILLAYQTNNKKIRVGLGPQISFRRTSAIEVFGDDGNFVTDYASEIADIDYGVMGSVGYSVGEARKGKGLYLQLRYYQGFSDLLKELPGNNLGSYFSIHVSLPFISDELARSNRKD